MNHRNFRIAWSVAWGLVALLLVALWVRSYWMACALAEPNLDIVFIANRGSLTVVRASDWRWFDRWQFESNLSPDESGDFTTPGFSPFRYRADWESADIFIVELPLWIHSL